MTVEPTDKCPWCDATGKWVKDGDGCILEWECSSYSSKSIAYQSDRCKVSVLQAKVERLQQELGNLLAVIHGDGGHHTDAVGEEQSVEDAHQVWAEQCAVVAKLPKTADDVPVVPGLTLFVNHNGAACPVSSYWVYSEGTCGVEIKIKVPEYDDPVLLSGFEIADCYSTQEAAEAAKESEE